MLWRTCKGCSSLFPRMSEYTKKSYKYNINNNTPIRAISLLQPVPLDVTEYTNKSCSLLTLNLDIIAAACSP